MIGLDTDAPRRAPKLLIHGVPGSGKSYLASGAPRGIVFDVENSTLAIGEWDKRRIVLERSADPAQHRYHPRDWPELIARTKEIAEWIESGAQVGTFVMDGFSRAEDLAAMYLCENWVRGKTKVKLRGLKEAGFSQGEQALLGEIRRLLFELERIWARNVAVVLLCHSRQYNMPNPGGADRGKAWGPGLTVDNNADVSGYVQGWVDVVAHIGADVEVVKIEDINDRVKVVRSTTGQRVLTLRDTADKIAKCRYTWIDDEIRLPAPPANGWRAFQRQLDAGPMPSQDIDRLRLMGRERAEKLPEEQRQKRLTWLADERLTARDIWNEISHWK